MIDPLYIAIGSSALAVAAAALAVFKHKPAQVFAAQTEPEEVPAPAPSPTIVHIEAHVDRAIVKHLEHEVTAGLHYTPDQRETAVHQHLERVAHELGGVLPCHADDHRACSTKRHIRKGL